MKITLFLLVALNLTSCKTLTKEGESVRIAEGTVPKECVRVGQVFSEAHLGANTGKNLLRNRAAEMDANTLVITKETNTKSEGIAYKCP